MHKHELAFQLSPHITNLNLNEPPLQIHQQAMTLLPSPSPTPYSTLLPPVTHIHQQAIISRYPSKPPHLHLLSTRIHSLEPPFLPQPHQLHSTHLIKRGRTGRRRNGGGSLYQDDFLRWLSWATKLSQALFCGYLPIVLAMYLLVSAQQTQSEQPRVSQLHLPLPHFCVTVKWRACRQRTRSRYRFVLDLCACLIEHYIPMFIEVFPPSPASCLINHWEVLHKKWANNKIVSTNLSCGLWNVAYENLCVLNVL